MLNYDDPNLIEVGIDEAGRGCLAGPIFAAAVILPKDVKIDGLRDSKKLSREKRKKLRDEIELKAIDFCVAYQGDDEIDKINITGANIKAMHEAINGLTTNFDMLLVDGSFFRTTNALAFKCFVGGDNRYNSIAAASILAKTYHDDYIEDLCKKYPKLNDYGWMNNQSYGSAQHIDAINKYGITKFHRKTFGICKTAKVRNEDEYLT
jgi:ribonuclease HII